MMTTYRSWSWRSELARFLTINSAITLTGCFAIAYFCDRTLAQITPDATLGGESSVVTPNINVGGQTADQIDGGAVQGENLFHSFLEFNVGEGQRVYFANPTGIENILTRVTGTDPSDILGTLGVAGGANLFLINPNGIIFGPNAQLDIKGSFLATTANSVVFEDGSQFSATNPEAPPLLTINLTPGLQYGSNPAGTISNAGNLTVGQNLTLAAGNLDLSGQLHAGGDLTLQATDTVRVRDSATNPFIASAGGQLVVQGNQKVDIFALNHPESGFSSGGDMILRSANTVGGDAHYISGGSFRIEQLDGSLGNLLSPYDPVILAAGDVELSSYTGGSLHILAGGKVNIPGTIEITSDPPGETITEDVILSDGTTIVSIDGSTYPTLDIRAGIDWTSLGGLPGDIDTGSLGPTFGVSATSADITIGNVIIQSPDAVVLITNQYQPNTSLPGGHIQVGLIDTSTTDGNSGAIFIDSRGGISLTDDISSRSTAASGNGGNITLLANGDITTLNINSSSQFLDAGQISLTSRYGAIDTSAGSLNSYADPSGRNGGKVTLTANGDIMIRNINSSGGELGGGGDITLTSNDTVSSTNSLIESDTNGPGKGGNIVVTAESVSFTNGAFLSSSTSGIGDAGDVNITATDTVSFDGLSSNGTPSGAVSQVQPGAQGNGGNISISTGSLSVTGGAFLSASTTGKGDAGDVNITSTETVLIDGVASNKLSSGVASRVNSGAQGNGGNINITTDSLFVTNGGQLNVSTSATGDAGNINITATDTVSFDNVGSNGVSSAAISRVAPNAVGNGGNITITTGSLSVTNGAELNVSTVGKGDAGNINVTATDTVSFDGESSTGNLSTAASRVESGAQGNGGNVNITTSSLSVTNGALLSASTVGKGDAGNVNITATDTVSFDGESSTGDLSAAVSLVNNRAQGNGGNVNITTSSLSVTNGAQLSASTLGKGDAGNVIISADTVSLDGESSTGYPSTVASRVGDIRAQGNGGNINITTDSLSVTNGALLSASTFGKGDAGDVNITADTVSLDAVGSDNGRPSAVVSQVDSKAQGNGGNININTDSLSVSNGAFLSASTSGKGDAGNVNIIATESVLFDGVGSDGGPSGAASTVNSGAQGNGGDINITTDSLSVSNGAFLSASTLGNGDAGDVNITATGSVSVTNSGIFSTVEEGAVGQGGNIDITADSLSLNNALLSSNSSGTGKAGDINVTADSISLDQGSIVAETTSGQGGNIKLQVEDVLLLRHGSLISTNAGTAQAGGDGGNITIDTTFIVAVPEENSDITANAYEGNGGRVNITAQGIFGIEFREDLTPLSDITASSDLGVNGVVEIDRPAVDPSRGLTTLPTDIVDPTGLIDRRCQIESSSATSQFTITGRGGLPPNPNDLLGEEGLLEDLGTPAAVRERVRDGKHTSIPVSPSSLPKRIVEAQGWVISPNGNVILTAQAPNATPQPPWQTPTSCKTASSPETSVPSP